jgi:hypothetical protein
MRNILAIALLIATPAHAQSKTGLYETLAMAYYAASKCPTQKVSIPAVALVLASNGEPAEGATEKIKSHFPKAERLYASTDHNTFCTATWALYGPQGSDAPMLLYGQPR